MKNILSVCIVAVLLFSGCKKDPERHGCMQPEYYDYFEFGYGGGFVGVHKFYVIKNAQLYPQDSTKPPLDVARYNIARVLIDHFPAYLWAHPNQSYGCLGCADEFVTGIRIRTGGIEYVWSLDNASDQLPAELRSYVAEVNRITDQLE